MNVAKSSTIPATRLVSYRIVKFVIAIELEVKNEQCRLCFMSQNRAVVEILPTLVPSPEHGGGGLYCGSERLTIPPNTPPLSELCVGFAIIDNSVALESNRMFSIKVLAPTRVHAHTNGTCSHCG